jgi:hypothetical protein
VQVFLADIVIDADDATLHEGKAALCGVGVDRAVSILSRAVTNRMVTAFKEFSDTLVCGVLIGEDVRSGVNPLPDCRL